MPRYLTKSRFKLGLDCPAKLYYTGKHQYPDTSEDDAFLEALAEGGYQVGALAKCYYPDGIEIPERGYDIPLQKTRELLSGKNVVVFEGAFQFKNLFIRADIIEKKANDINLIEVKSKSFDGSDSMDMLSKKGFPDSSWKDYIYDVAFQKYVITQAHPDWTVHAYLMLADKNSRATVDGLNQKFQLRTVEGERTIVEVVGDVSKAALGEEVLIRICVDDLIDKIFDGTDSPEPPSQSFVDYVHYLADRYERDEKIIVPIHKDCKVCEYQASPEEEKAGKLSGLKECWSAQLGWDDDTFSLPWVLDIWDFRSKQKLMDSGIYLMKDIREGHIGDIREGGAAMTAYAKMQFASITETEKTSIIKGLLKYCELDTLAMVMVWEYWNNMVAV